MTTERMVELLHEVARCPRLTVEQTFAVANAIDKLSAQKYKSVKKNKCNCGFRPKLWHYMNTCEYKYELECPNCGLSATGNTEAEVTKNWNEAVKNG